MHIFHGARKAELIDVDDALCLYNLVVITVNRLFDIDEASDHVFESFLEGNWDVIPTTRLVIGNKDINRQERRIRALSVTRLKLESLFSDVFGRHF